MGIAVYVMPLGANLRGDFQPVSTPRARRSEAEVDAAVESFLERLETLLGFRPEWHDEGPLRSATVFSVDGFSGPFLQARSWAYRLKLPRLCALEMPQVWLPVEFEPAFHFAAPWNPDADLSVASSFRLRDDLNRLLEEMEERPELAGTAQVADRLRGIAALSVEHRLPAIIEG